MKTTIPPKFTALLGSIFLLVCSLTGRGLELTTITTFQGGETPNNGLTAGTDSHLYIALPANRNSANGSVLQMGLDGTPLRTNFFNYTNGSDPSAPVIQDVSGNLYGPTYGGGTSNLGTIYKITPAGKLTRLFSFGLTNGSNPSAPLVLFGGFVYGSTLNGGSSGLGTLFELDTAGNFIGGASLGGTNGDSPVAALVAGPTNALYGTTEFGGTFGHGNVFRLDTNGINSIFSFDGSKGFSPAGMVRAKDGNFYGVTFDGAAGGQGSLFRVTPGGGYKDLVHFTGPNGATPNGYLVKGADGRIYGTTQFGGRFGFGTVFALSTDGTFTNVANFSGTNGAYPQGQMAQAPDGNFYGTTLGADGNATVFQLGGLVPQILVQPKTVSWIANRTAKFTVTSIGSQVLFYQWLKNGTNVSDTATISGSTSPQLVITHESLADAATYSVIVSNKFGIVTSSNALLAVPLPTITIAHIPATVSDPELTVSGTAHDKFAGVGVQFRLNGGPWTGADLSDLPTWKATVTLTPGTNLIEAFATDVVGNQSKVARAVVFYQTFSQLTLVTNGFGRIIPSVKTTTLPVGRNFTVQAIPTPKNLFWNWTISSDTTNFTSANNPLKVLMESNLVVQANFLSNRFGETLGAFNGLLFVSNSLQPATSGSLRALTIGTTGRATGKLVVAGATWPFTGHFDAAGHAEITVNRKTASGGPLTLVMDLAFDNAVIVGSVTGTNAGGWTAALGAERAAKIASAQYTMLIPPDPANTDDTLAPIGDGYALISNRLGTVTFSGKLADGTAFSETAPVSQSGQYPLYASLYSNAAGMLIGWLQFAPSNNPPKGNVWWIKTPAPSSTIYRNGFTNFSAVESSYWLPPPSGQPAIVPADNVVELSGGGLVSPLTFNISVNNNNTLSAVGDSLTNSFTGAINRKTGLLTIQFGNGNKRAVTSGFGAILQDQNAGGGFFILTNAGAISLH